MKYFLRSAEPAGEAAAPYESVVKLEARAYPGVRFAVQRMSFGRRMELSRRIREISGKAEFLNAGDELRDRIEANLLGGEIDEIYLRWGLVGIEELLIDGEPATLDSLIERGPEELAREMVDAIKAQCGLTEEERKN